MNTRRCSFEFFFKGTADLNTGFEGMDEDTALKKALEENAKSREAVSNALENVSNAISDWSSTVTGFSRHVTGFSRHLRIITIETGSILILSVIILILL